MVVSMTGYGKVSETFQGKKMVGEIRSLNSKSLDLNLRLPSNYRELELEIRAIIGQFLDRGKVEFNLNIENTTDSKTSSINKQLAKAYYTELKELAVELNDSSDILPLVLRMPEVMNVEKEALTTEEKAFVLNITEKACKELVNFREKEGKQLADDFTKNITAIAQLLTEIPQFEDERVDVIRERMRVGIEKLSTTKVDENRLEQEIIFYIEKLDVSEEKMRLSNHLTYFLETMDLPLCGKKLGFISQEIGREINTLGSKSYHVEMQKRVVDMKDHLEKIKEQILNSL